MPDCKKNKETVSFKSLEVIKKSIKKANKIVYYLKKNETFGEFSFFTGKLRECSARSLIFTHVGYIDFDDFFQIIRDYSNDFVTIISLFINYF